MWVIQENAMEKVCIANCVGKELELYIVMMGLS